MNNFEIKVKKSDFEKVMARHEPSKFIKIVFALFGVSSPYKVKDIIVYFLVAVFIVGFVGVAIESYVLTTIMTITFFFVLLGVVLVTMLAGYLNNRRIKAILKDLGVSYEEYLQIIYLKDVYFNEDINLKNGLL